MPFLVEYASVETFVSNFITMWSEFVACNRRSIRTAIGKRKIWSMLWEDFWPVDIFPSNAENPGNARKKLAPTCGFTTFEYHYRISWRARFQRNMLNSKVHIDVNNNERNCRLQCSNTQNNRNTTHIHLLVKIHCSLQPSYGYTSCLLRWACEVPAGWNKLWFRCW